MCGFIVTVPPSGQKTQPAWFSSVVFNARFLSVSPVLYFKLALNRACGWIFWHGRRPAPLGAVVRGGADLFGVGGAPGTRGSVPWLSALDRERSIWGLSPSPAGKGTWMSSGCAALGLQYSWGLWIALVSWIFLCLPMWGQCHCGQIHFVSKTLTHIHRNTHTHTTL